MDGLAQYSTWSYSYYMWYKETSSVGIFFSQLMLFMVFCVYRAKTIDKYLTVK